MRTPSMRPFSSAEVQPETLYSVVRDRRGRYQLRDAPRPGDRVLLRGVSYATASRMQTDMIRTARLRRGRAHLLVELATFAAAAVVGAVVLSLILN